MTTPVQTTRGFRGPEVCALAHITYRQLDYWARTDLVTPSVRDARGSGTQRLYSRVDVIDLKLVKALLDVGASLQLVRRVLPEARRDRAAGIVLPGSLVLRGADDAITITIDVERIAADVPEPPEEALTTTTIAEQPNGLRLVPQP